MEPSDAALCKRAQAGDQDAFALLFERHNRAVYNFCFRRVGNWSIAEDLLSIVFLISWRRRDNAPPDKVLPWLYGIATNVVRNQHRDERRFRKALERFIDSEQRRDSDPGLDVRLEDERSMKHLLELLERLPQREQDVFVLCAWMDVSYEDAAFALGVPIGTVRSRLSRARKHLMELEPDFGHKRGRREETIREGGSHEY